MGKITVRARVHKQFVRLHHDLCVRAFAGAKICHNDWKRDAGRELVALVRQKVGYSRKTGNGDIFWHYYNIFKDGQTT